jgi:hypothetical protein
MIVVTRDDISNGCWFRAARRCPTLCHCCSAALLLQARTSGEADLSCGCGVLEWLVCLTAAEPVDLDS